MSKKNTSDIIDIKGLIQEYLSKWYYFVISAAVCVLLVFLYAKIKNPVYGVRANVLIVKEDNNALSGMSALGDLFGSTNNVDDEIFVISSHSLYRDVARDLGTNVEHIVHDGLRKSLSYPAYPLDIVPASGIIDTLRGGVKFKVKVNSKGLASGWMKWRKNKIAEFDDVQLPYTIHSILGDFTLEKTSTYPEGESVRSTINVLGFDAAAEALAEEVSSGIANKRSNVINMAIDTPNPEYGSDVLNEIITKYNERGISENNFQSQKTAAFIDKRLDLLSKELSESESAIEEYKKSKGIVNVGTEVKYQSEKRGRLDEALLETETEAEIVRLTGEFLSDPANAYDLIPLSLKNDGLQKSIEAYNEIVMQRNELLAQSNDNNATVKRLTSRLDAMRGNIISSVRTLYANLEVQVREMKSQQSLVLGRLNDVPTQEREFLDMQREQSVKHQIYMFLLQRREETAMMIANAVPKGVIVDEAFTLSEPLGMSKKMMLALAFLFGLCIPPVYFSVRRMLRNKFDSRQDLEKILEAPVLGEMCIDNSGQSLVVTRENTESTAELFRLLRSNLLFILGGNNDKVVLITSSASGEGKSFISVNLSASLALLGKRVLLIGMDIRNPQLANYLNIAPKFGLTQYLASDKLEIEQLIYPLPGSEGLDIIVAGPVPPNPSELLASRKVDDMMAQLREMYDYIVVDTAPVGMVSDTFALDRIADATVFVTRVNYTSLNDVRFINEIYEDKRLKRLSVVVNGTTTKKNYTYGYGAKNNGKK